jgi:four helix bundle protein
MSISSYRDLVVWQEGMKLSVAVYQLTERFPKHKLYGLTSQVRRCSVSIPSNIAEGHARGSTREYLHYVSIALGSLAELETQLLLSKELGYTLVGPLGKFLELCDALGKRLRSLSKSLQIRAKRRKDE